MRKGEINNLGKDHQGQAASAQLGAKITECNFINSCLFQ